jgi:Tol biopolymer transport system component
MLRWSPDGSRLAAIFSRFGRDAGPALLVVDPATAKARELVHGSVGEIAWTPDSRFISAMTLGLGANDGAIVTFNAMNGDIETTVTSGPDASCQRGLAWSPDGKYLAYGGPGFHEGCGDVGNWGVWVWDKSTQTSKHLFRGGSDGPRWLENGNLVAMVSMPRSEGVPPLTLLRYESVGSEPSTLADSIPRMFPQPARMVQVAGNTVMYVVSTCDTAEAYLWNPEQAAPTRQTPAGVYAFEPTITPDGKQIAYVRVGDDQSELVVAPVGGGEARTVLRSDELGLQVGTQGPWGASGHWSPDGKWLAIEVTSEQEIDCVVLPGDRR